MAGKLPFNGSLDEIREQHQSSQLPADELRAAGVSDAILEILERSVHKQSIFRYKTARELNRALIGLKIDAGKAKRELERLVAAQRGRQPSAGVGVPTPPGSKGSSASSIHDTLSAAIEAKRQRQTMSLPTMANMEVFPPAQPITLPLPEQIQTAVAQAAASIPFALPIIPKPAAYYDVRPPRPGVLTFTFVAGLVVAGGGLIATAPSFISRMRVHGELEGASPSLTIFMRAADVADLLLIALLVAGLIAAFRLKRWARPALLTYALLAIIFQITSACVEILAYIPFSIRVFRQGMTFKTPAEADMTMMFLKMGKISALSIGAAAVISLAMWIFIVMRRADVRNALDPADDR